jgi:alcohol dehydrogenase
LQRLTSLDPRRVCTVSLRSEASAYAREIAEASEEADLVIDAFGAVTNADPTLACLGALRLGGTAAIVGGVRADIPLPYANILRKELTIRGSYMYPRSAPGELLQLIGSGVLSLEAFQVHSFPLSAINEAIAQAASFRGLDCCVVVP